MPSGAISHENNCMMWQVSQEEKNRNRSTFPEANARTHGLRSTASHGHMIRDVETVRDRACPAMTVVTGKKRGCGQCDSQ